MAINMLALPAYNPGQGIDFSPLNNALESNQRNALAQNQLGLQQRQLGMQEQRLGMERESHGVRMGQLRRQSDREEAEMVDGRVRYIQSLPVEQQGPAWQVARKQPGFRDLPAEFDDFNYAAPQLIGRAQQYLGRKEQAQIGLIEAQTAKAQREATEAGGYGRDIKLFSQPDGNGGTITWGVQAGSRGDLIFHNLSNPNASPMRVPRSAFGGGAMPGEGQAQPGAIPRSGPPPASHPTNVRPAQGQYGAPAASPPPSDYPTPPGLGGSPSRPVPQVREPLTPFRGYKPVGKNLIDLGSGRIAGDIEEPIRGGKFVEEDAKTAVADIKERSAAIQASRSKLPRLEIMEQLVGRPDVYQGTGGNAVVELKKAAQAFGIDVGDVSGSEAVRMISNQFALALRNPAGGEGMPGALSDRDLAFLVSSTPGLSNTRQGNQLMVRVMIELEKHKMKENAEASRFLHQRKSSAGLPEHMQAWAERNQALSKATRDRITGMTGIQYGVQSGPSPGPGVPKQFNSRLNETTGGDPLPSAGRGSFASPGLGNAIPSIRGDDDYQSLPSGSQYYAPDGSLRRKN